MTYIIYTRVSKEEQDVTTQEQLCKNFIEQIEQGNPYRYQLFSDPDVSSGLPMEKRPGLVAMRKVLRKGDKVVVFKLDRLSRDIIEMVTLYREIKSKSCEIHSLSESTDEFTVGLMGVLAQKERADISLRTKAKLNVKKQRGERISGHLPYGFSLAEDGIQLVPESAEQTVLALMCQLFDEGRSYRLIGKILNSQGYKNRQGNPFQTMSIYRILCRTGRTRSWDQPLPEREVLSSH